MRSREEIFCVSKEYLLRTFSYKNMKDAVKARRGAESLLAAIGFEK